MPFPHSYSVGLNGDRLTANPRPPIAVGVPPQFGGTNEAWSPENFSRAVDVPVDIVASVRARE